MSLLYARGRNMMPVLQYEILRSFGCGILAGIGLPAHDAEIAAELNVAIPGV